MELPKNIKQIGESDHNCKIYVEDYVVSYIKQLNQLAWDKDMAVALYGVRKTEGEVAYLFLYGACKLTFLQRESRQLSQAQEQEIEELRKRYFEEYSFLGYRLLNGEMVEGFHIYTQGSFRYVRGYAQFYEKNDLMLAYMLDARSQRAPEQVDQEKYEVVKKRQEQRKIEHEEAMGKATNPSPGQAHSIRKVKAGMVAVFALLCLVVLSSAGQGLNVERVQVMARQVLNTISERRHEEEKDPTPEADNPTLIAEEKLANAILDENTTAQMEAQVQEEVNVPEEMPAQQEQSETEEVIAQVEQPQQEEVAAPEDPVQDAALQETEAQPNTKPESYTIRQGDTLIGISIQNYGNDAYVSEICEINQIQNPDDIKVGQKILLP